MTRYSISRSRPSLRCDRMPGTSAWSVIAGTITFPSRSRPITAGGPPPEANTRSNCLSSSFAARRKSDTTLSTPRRTATSRISSAAQASIWSSDCSASRSRYVFGSSDRPVLATVPPARWGDPQYARGSPRIRASATAGRAAGSVGERGPRPLRPVIEQLGHPASHAARRRQIRRIRDECVELRPCPRGERGDRLARWAALAADRVADRDPDPTPKREPAGAADRHRDDRHARAKREVRGPLVERQQLRLAEVDPTLARDGKNAAGIEHRLDPARRVEQVVLARLVRDGGSGPQHHPVPPA